MKIIQIVLLFLFIFCSCKNVDTSAVIELKQDKFTTAAGFIDAFYSFEQDSLKGVLQFAEGSQPSILYYQ